MCDADVWKKWRPGVCKFFLRKILIVEEEEVAKIVIFQIILLTLTLAPDCSRKAGEDQSLLKVSSAFGAIG